MPAVAQRRLFVIVAAAGALVVAVAPAGADRPTQRGTLTLSHRVDTSHGGYIEGSISYLHLRRGHRVVLRRSRAGPIHVRLHPRAGLYRIVSFQRPCDGNCSVLDPPTDRCSERLHVYAGEPTSIRAVTRPGHGCTIRIAEPRAVPVHPAGAGGAALRPRAGGFAVRPDRHPRAPARLPARTGPT